MEVGSYFIDSDNVTELTPKDFNGIATWKLKNKECSAVLFYAPWCPHCKAVKDEWESFGKTATFMNVYAFDSQKYLSHLSKIQEDMPKLVISFPTIIFYKNGDPDEQFMGDRTSSNFLKKGMEVCSNA
jgi:thiol-disulfide isomerase/thioredoxin